MSRPAANIASELETRSLIKLYELDYGPAIGQALGIEANIRRFVGDTELDGRGVALDGVPYDPLPLRDSGFATVSRDSPARPTLEVFNGDGIISLIIDGIGDISGARVKRILIFPEHLDDGDDPDPLAYYDPDVYRIERIAAEDRFTITFELSSLVDVDAELPGGVATSDFCRWIYLDPDTCGWDNTLGPFFGEADGSVGTIGEDVCGLRSKSCKIRFETIPAPLRFGGFVGIARLVS